MAIKKSVKKDSVGNATQILFNVEHQVSLPCVVAQGAGVQVGSKKIVKAGTPLKGTLGTATAMTKATDGTGIAGLLLHDVDVTDGDSNGAVLVFGFVNLSRLESDTKALVTEPIKTALPMIKCVELDK